MPSGVSTSTPGRQSDHNIAPMLPYNVSCTASDCKTSTAFQPAACTCTPETQCTQAAGQSPEHLADATPGASYLCSHVTTQRDTSHGFVQGTTAYTHSLSQYRSTRQRDKQCGCATRLPPNQHFTSCPPPPPKTTYLPQPHKAAACLRSAHGHNETHNRTPGSALS